MKIENWKRMETMPEWQNSSKWQKRQQEVAEMKERYGTAEQFLHVFNPDLQCLAARCLQRTYEGTAPTLLTVADGYGEPTATVWICMQLESVNLFAGVKEKMPVSRQKELSGLIITEYPYLKVSELLLFFYRLKCGRYGRFYGMVDALFITTALIQFTEERRKEMPRWKKPDRLPEVPASSGGITYDEYLELKRRKEGEDENQ